MHKTIIRFAVGFFILCVIGMFLGACGPTQQSVQDRNNTIGTSSQADSNFAEARQIKDIEAWKDDPGKIVFLFVNFPPNSDNVLIVQCKGVPASSTEILEPNEGVPSGFDTDSGGWVVPIDGVDAKTREMAGRDGTFGDPVPYRQCLTVDGTYIDIPNMGVPYMVSSVPYTFPPSTVKRDFESEARLLKAEEIIRRGGCVNNETLMEIKCPADDIPPTPLPGGAPPATATPEGK